MINKLRLFGLIVLALITITCNAQKKNNQPSSQLKKKLTLFLISKKILEKTDNLTKYYKMVYVTNLKDNSFLIDDGIGVYAVGASISHSKTFLLLKNKKSYTFREIGGFQSLLVDIVNLLYKDPKMSDEVVMNYLNNISNFYRSNKSKEKGIKIYGH